MKKETRTVVYDDELRMEAYRFEGIVQPFPSHFHEHYVIGFVENGERVLSCRDREYVIEEGSIVLFNPGDSHVCVQSDEGTFDCRGFNISKEIMLDLAEEVTGKRELPGFSEDTTGGHWQRAGRMTRETLCRCASPAMRGFMRNAAIAGRKSNRQEIPQRWNYLPVYYFLKRSECEPVSIRVSVKISFSMR